MYRVKASLLSLDRPEIIVDSGHHFRDASAAVEWMNYGDGENFSQSVTIDTKLEGMEGYWLDEVYVVSDGDVEYDRDDDYPKGV